MKPRTTHNPAIGPLISADWLATRIDDPGIRVLDASWHMPDSGRDAKLEYVCEHIPGAGFFDLDGVSDPKSPLPHTLPSPDNFSRSMRELGISNDSLVVVYDTGGVAAAARARWMFRAFGHDQVVLLDGGLTAWKAGGRPLDSGDDPFENGDFRATAPSGAAVAEDIMTALQSGSAMVVDARGPGRFSGTEPEPRAGVRSGHMPGARNVYYADLYGDDGKMRPLADLRMLFEAAQVDLERPVITTCGSGVTACCLALALELLGKTDVQIYDGSWSEWGGRADLPVQTGSDPGQLT